MGDDGDELLLLLWLGLGWFLTALAWQVDWVLGGKQLQSITSDLQSAALQAHLAGCRTEQGRKQLMVISAMTFQCFFPW